MFKVINGIMSLVTLYAALCPMLTFDATSGDGVDGRRLSNCAKLFSESYGVWGNSAVSSLSSMFPQHPDHPNSRHPRETRQNECSQTQKAMLGTSTEHRLSDLFQRFQPSPWTRFRHRLEIRWRYMIVWSITQMLIDTDRHRWLGHPARCGFYCSEALHCYSAFTNPERPWVIPGCHSCRSSLVPSGISHCSRKI